MNLLTAIPKNVRLWLYVVYAVAGPVLLWTKAHGWTGQTEVARRFQIEKGYPVSGVIWPETWRGAWEVAVTA